MIILKNPDQLAKMRSAGHLLHDVLQQVREMICPGITTMDVNRYTDELIRKAGAIPTELGYYDYPASICASIDDEVVHGIPSENVTLMEGSILSVDVTLALDGWQADSAFTAPVGKISEAKQRLIRVTEECFWKGAAAAINGNRIGDIGFAVQSHAEKNGYNAVRDLTGHGIGRKLHESPEGPNYGKPGRGPRLVPGMTICIEPMINSSTADVKVLPDKWTVVEANGNLSAHFEHTICITNGEPIIMTLEKH